MPSTPNYRTITPPQQDLAIAHQKQMHGDEQLEAFCLLTFVSHECGYNTSRIC
jgi:hypothetical protein